MKKILMILVLFVSLKTIGQDKLPFVFTLPENKHLADYFGIPANYQYRVVYERIRGMMVDSAFHLPRYNGVPSGLRVGSSNNDGALVSDTLNGHVYHYWNLVWNRLANYTDIAAGAVNIYNSNGILTGNRTLTGLNDTYNLTLDSLNQFSTGRAGITRIYHNSSASGLYSPDGLNHNYVTNAFASFNINSGANYFITLQDSSKTAKKISYEGNLHGLFNAYTLVDKSYVDSAVGGSASTADGYSVLGRTGSASGTAVSITAGTNEDVLFRNGNVLQFGKPNLLARQGNQIGFLLNKTSLADTVGLTGGLIGGATYTISGNKLVVVVSGDYSWVRYDSLTSLDVIQGDWVVSFNSFGVAREAQFGIHDRTFPGNGNYSIYGTLSTRNDNGTLGRMYIISRNAAGAGTTLATSASDLGMSVNDSIQVKFDKFENTIIFSARNMTTGSAWVSVPYTLVGTETSHSVGSIGIVTGTNDYNIHQFKVTSKQVKNPDVYLFGDSKFTKATYQNESLPALLKNNYNRVYANCAVGSTSADLLANMWEVVNVIQPAKVLINMSNDIRFGVSSGTWQANLTTIYNALTANGIDVYFTCLYETSADQAAMDTWLTANYPSNYIRSPFVDLQKYGSGILVDGIHLSAIGNRIVADALTLDTRLEAAAGSGGFTQLEDFVTEDAWTTGYINGSGDYTPLALGTSGKVLTSNGASSAPTWETPSAGAWNTIISPTGDQALTFQAGESSTWTDQNTTEDLFTVNNATQTTGSMFSLNRTSTAITTGNNIMEIISSGANVASSTEANGLVVSVTNTGTGSVNRAAKFTASGAATNNVALETVGRVGVNEPSPQTLLQVGNSAGQTSAFGTGAQLLVTASGSSSYLSVLGPSSAETFIGSESGLGIFGTISNHPLVIRSNNTARLTVATSGAIKHHAYGAGTFTGTPARFPAYESDGDIIEVTASSLKPSLNKGVFIQAPTSADIVDVWQTPVAITVTSIKAILRGTSPSVTYNVRFGTDITSATTVFTSDITCTSVTTGCSNSSGFNDATIPAGSFIWVVTTASSGTITSISLTLNYTED